MTEKSLNNAYNLGYEQRERERGWRVMSSAPKTGTKIDIWVVHHKGTQHRECDSHYSKRRNRWINSKGFTFHNHDRLTHWMHVARPPTD